MAKRKQPKTAQNVPRNSPQMSSAPQSNEPRQNAATSLGTPAAHATRQLNVAPPFDYGKPSQDTDAPWTLARLLGWSAAMIHMSLPYYINWGSIIGLIFGGCCSNVFSLELIVKEEPESGLLITFVQFLSTMAFTWPAHFSASHPPFFLKPRGVPLIRWLPNILMFFAVNMLNNFAFGYNISVPVHIILRSGGSVMTMLVGFAWGKRYTSMQIFSVSMLTVGIIMAAMADAQAKGKKTSKSTLRIDPEFITGLVILAVAQFISAIMGLYTQLTYAKYGSHWHENLFYSHFLSLPLFLPFFPYLFTQFKQLLSSPPIQLVPFIYQWLNDTSNNTSNPSDYQLPSTMLLPSIADFSLPKHVLTLTLNALTQYACIRGVNLLGARTSALGVSITLNIRKLASLLLSIWLFGNKLPLGVMLGAAVVFGSAGIWAWESQRIWGRDRSKGKTKAG